MVVVCTYPPHILLLCLDVVTTSSVVQGFTRQEYSAKSVTWAQDEEFTTLIHSLPSWANMYSQDRPHRTKMAQRDVHLYAEEAQKFMEHFVDDDITSSQVVVDPSDLRRIAQVHESVVSRDAWGTGGCLCISQVYGHASVYPCYIRGIVKNPVIRASVAQSVSAFGC